MNKHTYRSLLLPGLTLVFIIALALVKFLQIRSAIAQHSNFKPPPDAVTTFVAVETEWNRELGAVGTLAPVQGATLSTELAGTVSQVLVESGKLVNAGEVLVALDTTVEDANLQAARARAQLARQNLARAESLKSSAAMSKADLDNAQAQFNSATAEVAALVATIERKKVIAPFSGRAGIRMVNVGQYVEAGTPIIPLYSLDKMYLDFSLPERSLSDVKVGAKVAFRVEAVKDRTFEGSVEAVNPQIDETTRNFSVRAVVQNDNEVLRPGMYARVTLTAPGAEKSIIIPASSVNYAPYGDSVYVVTKLKDPHGEEYTGVQQQIVQLGDRRGDQISVISGLKPGQEVVSSGVFKLRPGAAIVVNNSFTPGNDPAPQPQDT